MTTNSLTKNEAKSVTLNFWNISVHKNMIHFFIRKGFQKRSSFVPSNVWWPYAVKPKTAELVIRPNAVWPKWHLSETYLVECRLIAYRLAACKWSECRIAGLGNDHVELPNFILPNAVCPNSICSEWHSAEICSSERRLAEFRLPEFYLVECR